MVVQRTTLLYVAFLFLLLGILAAGVMTDSLLMVLIAIVVVYGLIASYRYPFILLVAYAVAIPFEDILKIGGALNTLTKGVGILFAAVYVLTQFRNLKFHIIPAALWAWLGWNIVSLIWTPTDFFAMSLANVSVYIQQFVMVFLMANMLQQNPKRIPILLAFYSLATTITSIYCVYNFMQGADLTEGNRTGAFEEQSVAHFAAMVIPGLLFLVHCIIQTKSQLYRLCLISLASIQSIAIILSGTRSAWMGLVAAMLFLFLANFNWKKAVAVILCAAFIWIGINTIPQLEQNIMNRSEQAVDTGGAGRTTIWEHGLGVFEEHPIIGTGSGNYRKYNPEGFGPHNIYLGAAIQTGIIGLVLMLAALWVTFRAPSENKWGLLLKALLIAYFVQSFFLETTIFKYFWFAIGLALGGGLHKSPALRFRSIIKKEPISS
jgi:exopolysaccharide production protein ExoQ